MTTELAIPEPQELSTWSDRRLENAIKRGHAACGRFMEGYEHTATLTGVLLRERKSRLGPRKFEPWLREHFSGGKTTAYEYIRMANERAPISSVERTDTQPEPGNLKPAARVGQQMKTSGGMVATSEPSQITTIQTECPHCHGTGWVDLEETA